MKTALIKVQYSKIRPIEESNVWQGYMNELSEAQQTKINRFVFWEDRCRSLFGKVLLKNLLDEFGFDGSLISKIQHTPYGRPYLNLPLDFNISHSGEYVICAASLDSRVGIDIEAWKNIDFREFKMVLTDREWLKMHTGENHVPEFFRIWAQKESVIKADGQGLSIPLNRIEANNFKIVDQGFSWYLKELKIMQTYSCWLATDILNPKIELSEVFL